jgi:hypothetical protein
MTVLQAAGGLRARAIGGWLVGRRAGKAALWLGLLLVFALSNLANDRAGQAPTQRNWVFGRLNREHTYGQTFVVERDTLVALRVLLFANPSGRDDPVTLRLRYADADLPSNRTGERGADEGAVPPELAVVTLPLRALARQELTTFAFPPLALSFPPGVVTATLRLDLDAPTLPPSEWVTVMAGPDTYGGGQLLVDGEPEPSADLAFQPVYQRRWFDLLLPITRMAHDKPGLLGWPPLYALLAYGCCVIAARLILALWRCSRCD